MIRKRFRVCPQKLWITLWAILARNAQVLDSTAPVRLCSISGQRFVFNKINDLGAIRANPDGRSSSRFAVDLQHDFWG
jgi:hypothetical protein